MTGYRQSGFDPNAFEQAGRPLRPFNWVQWSGVALGMAGIVLSTLHLAGRFGLVPPWIDDSSPWSLILIIVGVVLINSRREPSTLAGSEQLEKNRRVLLVTALVIVAILGAAALIDSLGAF